VIEHDGFIHVISSLSSLQKICGEVNHITIMTDLCVLSMLTV